MQHAFNIRKERRRTVSKKDEWLELGGGRSGSASRCISPDFKEVNYSNIEMNNFGKTRRIKM